MKRLIERVMNAANKYTAFDFAFLKIMLLSIGILLGTYYASFFINYTTPLWVVFVISYAWVMYRTFIKHMR